MKGKRLCRFAISLVLAGLCVAVLQSRAWAGTTGKIAGRVTDASTKEPLPMASVVLEGTTLGASTDPEGDYFIINIPPGTYSVTASYVGYDKLTKTDVEVDVDRTITVNFELKETVIELEEVVIEAEREVIQLDVGGSQNIMDTEDLVQPVASNVLEALSVQPNIYRGQVRGGGTDETLLLLDGNRLVDERLNEAYMGVNATAIQEVQINTGGFNAEYGNLRSGLFNVITREGRPGKLNLFLNYRFSPAAKKHFGPDAFGPDTWEWKTFATPEALDPVYDENGKQIWKGWKAVSEALLADTDPENDMTPEQAQALWKKRHPNFDYADRMDHNFDATLVGTVPGLDNLRFLLSHRFEVNQFGLPWGRDDPDGHDAYRERNTQVKLDYVTSKYKVTATGLLGKIETLGQFSRGWAEGGGSSYADIRVLRDVRPSYMTFSGQMQNPLSGGPDEGSDLTNSSSIQSPALKYLRSAWALVDRDINMFGLKLNYILSPSTYFDLSAQRFAIDYKMGPGRERDLTKRQYTVDGITVTDDERPDGFAKEFEMDQTGIFNMSAEDVGAGRDSSTVRTYTIAGNITSQVDKRNQVKAGFEAVLDDIHEESGQIIVRRGEAQWKIADIKPRRFSAYVQDRLELRGMIATFGLRLEYLNPNATFYFPDYAENYFGDYALMPSWYNRLEPQYYSVAENLKEWVAAGVDGGGEDIAPKGLTTEDAKTRLKLSPRVSVSFPTSDVSKVYFNYGHFYTMPRTRHLFGFFTSSGQQLFNWMGNPNLDWARTVMYEVGYAQSIADMYQIRLSGYVKDATDQIGFTNYYPISRSTAPTAVSENKYYRDIRGLDIRLEKTVGRFLTGWINYGLQLESSGQLGFDKVKQDPREADEREDPTQRKPDAIPTIRASIDLHSPKGWGPEIGGIYPFEGISVNALQWWAKGQKGTWDPGRTGAIKDNVRWRDVMNTDLRIRKTLEFGGIRPTVYVDIHNLFNRRQINPGAFTGEEWEEYMNSLNFEVKGQGGKDRIGDWNKGYIKLPKQNEWAAFIDPRDIFFGVYFDMELSPR